MKTKLPLIITAAILLLLLVSNIYQHNKNTQLEEELDKEKSITSKRSTHRTAKRDTGSRSKTRKHSTTVSTGDINRDLNEPDPLNRMLKLLTYANSLPSDQIPEMLEKMSHLNLDEEQQLMSRYLLTRWAKENPDAAYKKLSDIANHAKALDTHDPSRSALFAKANSIMMGLAAKDPAAAAAWYSQVKDNPAFTSQLFRSKATDVIASEWARQDAQAALKWAQNLPGMKKGKALSIIMSHVAITDPHMASTIIMQMKPGNERNKGLKEIATTWANSAPADALAWSQTLEGHERSSAFTGVVSTWAKSDPAAVAKYLDEMPDRQSTDSLLQRIGSSWEIPLLQQVSSPWASRDPAQAAKWLTGQTDGAGKNKALKDTALKWARKDHKAAADWLHTLPDGPAKENAITGFIKALPFKDLETAKEWAPLVKEEALRIEVAVRLREVAFREQFNKQMHESLKRHNEKHK